ncbi:hypothetical protein T484DRAFT_1783614 [Baffinella frigidus]|nr:hypothetical protein T484DRAFT_1783614 [Cryptophyta sp. CCMP2293]
MIQVRSVVSHVASAYPYYNRSSGSDHVLALTSDWGSCLGPLDELRNMPGPLDELRNMPLLITSGDRSTRRPAWYVGRAKEHMGSSPEFAVRAQEPCFQPHKDVAIPPLLPGSALTEVRPSDRPQLKRDIQVTMAAGVYAVDALQTGSMSYV